MTPTQIYIVHLFYQIFERNSILAYVPYHIREETHNHHLYYTTDVTNAYIQ